MRLIDADALERVLDMIPCADIKNMDGQAYVLVRLSQVYNVIKNAPTIEPERKKGKWLPDNNNYIEERFICSVCGRSYKVDTCMGKPMWDFCPCGADMRGE